MNIPENIPISYPRYTTIIPYVFAVNLKIIIYYHLVMTNSSPWYRWHIEIDDVPIKIVIFHGKLLNNQMVFLRW
jgi:hypothetical protein